MIPKIMKYKINPNTTNIIKNYISDDSYFISVNTFILNSLKIGPMSRNTMLTFRIGSLLHKSIAFPNADVKVIKDDNDKYFFIVVNSIYN